MRSSAVKAAPKSHSLLSKLNMGGIIGGDGYSFQERFIACKIPEWLLMPGFQGVMQEGFEDVDVHFSNPEAYELFQIKDHLVNLAELTSVLSHFSEKERLSKTFRRFTLVCPGIDNKIRSLHRAINRCRGGKAFHSSRKLLKPTEKDFNEILKKNGFSKYKKLILEKFEIEIEGNAHDGSKCADLFVARLQKHPQHNKKIRALIEPAHRELALLIRDSKGKGIKRQIIEAILEKELVSAKRSEKFIDIAIHNWAKVNLGRKIKYELDWSSYFDPATRRVPNEEAWSKKLLPSLEKLKTSIIKQTSDRFVRFNGKCSLTTGFLVGRVFPQVGDWNFEIMQPPLPSAWRSDAVGIQYDLKLTDMPISKTGKAIALAIGITANISKEVEAHIRASKIRVKKLICIEPASGAKSNAIANDREAVSVAEQIKDITKEMLAKEGLHETHIFYCGPFALALFLGRKLTSVGRLHHYEYAHPGYKKSCALQS